MQKCQLLFYRNLNYQHLFDQIYYLLTAKKEAQAQYQPDSLACASQLIEIAQQYGFEGNVWHCFLALCMMENENAYSLGCEKKEKIPADLYQLAQWDFQLLKQLFDDELTTIDQDHKLIWELITDYHSGESAGKALHFQMKERMLTLTKELETAVDADAFQQAVTRFYQEYGVGELGLNKAFRMSEKQDARLIPIKNVEMMRFSDIVGYGLQKQKLIANTESFIQGKAANNVLLYGDAGTGKSSSIKAILNEYYDQGLRMIEIYKHQFRSLSNILEQIKDRNYKFIVYMDDLSFEDHEVEYKYLKAIIEGGLGKKPDNVLIYATSNRRHLIREKFSDKKSLDDELHGNDTVQEKLSLAARFGVSIYFGSPDKKEYEEIIEVLADHYGIQMSKEELLLGANRWELSHGGRSGRTAIQFITHLLGVDE